MTRASGIPLFNSVDRTCIWSRARHAMPCFIAQTNNVLFSLSLSLLLFVLTDCPFMHSTPMIHDRHSVRQQPSPTSVRGAVVTAFRTEDGGSIAPGFLERLSTKRCPLGSESLGVGGPDRGSFMARRTERTRNDKVDVTSTSRPQTNLGNPTSSNGTLSNS